VAVLIAGSVALAVVDGGGPDSQAFGQTVAKAAQGGLSAVRTGQLAGQAELTGRVTRTFLSPLLDDAVQGVATAQRELAQTPPPNVAAAGTRDELMKLLDEAVRATGDLVGAFHRGDGTAAHAAVDALGPIGDRLADFVERQQR
jgi:hypothetical protein